VTNGEWQAAGKIARRVSSGEWRATRFRKKRAVPAPLPGFLEVLILNDFKSLFPEVLILRGFKSLFSEVLILVELKLFRMSLIAGNSQLLRRFLEVLILGKLKREFSEVLILEGLEVKNAIVCSEFIHNHSTNYTRVSI